MKSVPSRHNGEFLDPDEVLADSTSVLGSRYTPEGKLEKPIGSGPPLLFLGLVILGFLYLAVRAATLQIASGEKFFIQSQQNRFLTRTTFAPRGVIYDQHQTPLVENLPAFGLVLEPRGLESVDLTALLERLSIVLGKPLEHFYELGFPRDNNFRLGPERIFLAQNLSPEELVRLAAELDHLPGLGFFESYRRAYLAPEAMSHLLGFTGKVSGQDLTHTPSLRGEDTVGKSGLEARYDPVLRGQAGRKIVEVDSQGRETKYKLLQESRSGQGLRLTLDADLQRVSYELFQNYTQGRNSGSVVVLDPRSGAVRALVSFPGFDTNALASGVSTTEFNAILTDPRKPMFNRSLSGEFPSGSTIKPLLATAALEEKIIDPLKKIYAPGFIEVPNPYRPGESSVFLDWRKHGWVDLSDAIALSANVYFYTIGGGYGEQAGLGIQRIRAYLARFGLGQTLGIDLPGEKSGFLPDPASKRITEPQDPVWRVGDTYNVSIGQGGLRVTPLQIAAATAAIANRATLWRPYVVEAILDAEKRPIQQFHPTALQSGIAAVENLERVIEGMRQAVTRGTAPLLANLPVAAAAKTGTAQTGANRLPHAWITAFAPVEDPEIVLVVMLEHAGEGSTAAGPIAREILNWYFTR